jgi:hypothetical protein
MCHVLTCDDVNLWGKNVSNFKRNMDFYIVNMEFGLHMKNRKAGHNPMKTTW